MKKTTLTLLLLLLMPTTLALTTPITVTTWTDNTTHTTNISQATTNWTYNGNTNQTDTINIAYSCPDNTQIIGCENVLQNLSNMMSALLEAEKDKKAYFDLYASCNANLSVCKDKEASYADTTNWKNKYETELPTCQNEKNKCVNTDLPTCQNERNLCVNTDLPKCRKDLEKANSDKILYAIIVGALGAGGMWLYFNKSRFAKQPKDEYPGRGAG